MLLRYSSNDFHELWWLVKLILHDDLNTEAGCLTWEMT